MFHQTSIFVTYKILFIDIFHIIYDFKWMVCGLIYINQIRDHLFAHSLVWFLCLMAYQLLVGYLMPNLFSQKNSSGTI